MSDDDRIKELEAACAEMRLALLRRGTRHSLRYLENSTTVIGGKEIWVCPECHESTPVEYQKAGFPVTPQEFPHKPRCMVQQMQQALSSDAGKGWISPQEALELRGMLQELVDSADSIASWATFLRLADRARKLLEVKP